MVEQNIEQMMNSLPYGISYFTCKYLWLFTFLICICIFFIIYNIFYVYCIFNCFSYN